MSKRKHILVVSQYFYPEQFRINDMCMEWVKRGYKVTVLTGIPNYPQGKYFEGYDLVHKRLEVWNGVRIIRIPLAPRGNTSIGLAANYFSFVLSGYVWKCFTKIKTDYVFTFEVSPMTQALIGCWYAKKNKIPHYLYVQDLWPENVETVTGIHSPIVLKPIGRMVDYIYKNTDEIFATSPSFVDAICKRGVSQEKVHYWPQYAEEFYCPLEPRSDRDSRFTITFTGNVGYAQGLDILPKTAELLKTTGKNVRFLIVGDGRYMEEFENEIKRRNVSDMFELSGRKPAEEIPQILANSDAAFLSFMDNPLFSMTIPAKLQSYMACGIPIIAAASGETKRIIREAECGECCKIGDANKLKNIIIEIMNSDLNMLGKKSRQYFEKHFIKKMLMDKIEKYLK